MPPYSLIAMSPLVPSFPVPESMMQTAFWPWSSARDRKRVSMGVRVPRGSTGGVTRRTVFLIVRVALGGMI